MNSNRATQLYYQMLGAHGLIFYIVVTINIVYQIELANLNPLQLILVGTALELGILLFEIPTGIIADTISRRRSVIIGYFVVGAGFILEGLFPLFWTIMIASAVWGIGYTFISGAREAWIADESQSDSPGKIFLRGEQIFQLMAIVGMAISVLLASLTELNVPVVIGGILFVLLGVILHFKMPEENFQPTPREDRSTWHHMRETLQSSISLIRVTPVLITILSISLLHGIATEGFDRLWQKQLLDQITLPQFFGLDPVFWFGAIFAASMTLSALGTEITRRWVDTEHHLSATWTLLVMNGVISIAVIWYGVNQSFLLALVAYWVIMPLRHIAAPLYLAWLNQRVVSKVRASIFSIRSLADAVGQTLAAPVVGLVGLFVSVPAAIVAAGLIWLVSLPFYLRARSQ